MADKKPFIVMDYRSPWRGKMRPFFDDFDDLPKYFTNWTVDYLNDLDTSEYPFPNTLWHIKPVKEVALKSTAMIVVGVFGIFLNTIILVILIRNKWLWTASNYLIGNLALADLLNLILCPWFMLIRDFYQNYVLKNFGCRFEGFLQATLLLASVIAVMIVSYDRLAAAALTSEARITKAFAPKLIIMAWIIPIGLSLPWMIKRQYMERQWLDFLESFCVEDLKVLGIYWHFIVLLLVWIPLGVMVTTYGTIMWRLEWSARELASRGGGQTVSRARTKALRITACVLIATTVCRIPYTIMVYWRNNLNNEINAVEGGYEIMWFTANFLMYVNSAINPLIYGFTNVRFRRAMDRTPGIRRFRFGAWCCICATIQKKHMAEQNNDERVFVIDNNMNANRKFSRALKNILQINKQTIELSVPKDECTKPTKLTPLRMEQI